METSKAISGVGEIDTEIDDITDPK